MKCTAQPISSANQKLGPAKVPAYVNRKCRHYSGSRHHSNYCYFMLFPSAPSDYTGTVSGNRYNPTSHPTSHIEGPLSHVVVRARHNLVVLSAAKKQVI